MHKYVPQIWIIRCDDAKNLNELFSCPASSFIFKETEFIAVTAYQVRVQHFSEEKRLYEIKSNSEINILFLVRVVNFLSNYDIFNFMIYVIQFLFFHLLANCPYVIFLIAPRDIIKN